METPILSSPAVVGKFYMVPCVRLVRDKSRVPMYGDHNSADKDGWIPVIGPEHHDRDTIGFKPMHLHVDVRFLLAANLWSSWRPGWTKEQHAMSLPVSTFSDGIVDMPIKMERELRRKQCRREMPDFPKAGHSPVWVKFEQSYSACKLKPGNICPHRGIDLTPFIKADGTVVCPGHGLRWDTTTGNQLPHHSRTA